MNKEKTKSEFIKTLENLYLETIDREYSLIKKNYEHHLNQLFKSDKVIQFMRFDHG